MFKCLLNILELGGEGCLSVAKSSIHSVKHCLLLAPSSPILAKLWKGTHQIDSVTQIPTTIMRFDVDILSRFKCCLHLPYHGINALEREMKTKDTTK